MGGCLSSPKQDGAAARHDAEIDKKNREDFERDQAKVKLLLLGAGESGKSTIFKQMRILYGAGYSADERRQMLPVVFANTITSMKALIVACKELNFPPSTPEAAAAAAEMAAVLDDAAVDAHIASLVATLWADAGVQQAYGERHRFQLNDSAQYFFEKAAEVATPGYAPSVEDVLKTRVRTTGILEEEYLIDKVRFCVYDVGGQKNERRKWIHAFDEVTAIIFVAAISEYDQVMFEDSSVNRLADALRLFEDVCNSRYFENTSIILFLNKRDLFAEKIKTTDLRQPNPDAFAAEKEPMLFADYTGGCDYDAAVKYVVGKFLAKNKNPKKEIFWRVTCATDTDNVATVFGSAKEIILKENLMQSGLLD